MRVLGIDYGDKKIGLAVSDLLQLTAQAIGYYERRGKEEDRAHFKSLVARYDISEIVIGLPLRMDGTKGTRVKKTEEFADWLKEELNLPVFFWDERLTTRQALHILREQDIKQKPGRKLKDQISAGLILAAFLEYRRNQIHDA